MTKTFLKILTLIVVVLILGCLNGKRNTSNPKSEKISTLLADDEIIKKYKDTAQAHISYLIEFMGEHDKSDTLFRYAVKSNFSESGFNEHMWSQVTEYKDGYFIGTLANDPINVTTLKFKDRVKIRKEDVEDWILQDFLTNTEVGSYSRDYLHKTSN